VDAQAELSLRDMAPQAVRTLEGRAFYLKALPDSRIGACTRYLLAWWLGSVWLPRRAKGHSVAASGCVGSSEIFRWAVRIPGGRSSPW
jgi:hypothetical protein